jgi:DNA gyrase subunit B
MEQIAHGLTRRGINLQQFLKKRHPETGLFPKYLVTIGGNGAAEQHYVYTDADLTKLREEVERRIGRQLEIFSDDAGEAAQQKSAFRWIEIRPAGPLAKLVSAMEKKGFSIDQYETKDTPLCFVTDSDNLKRPVHSLPELLHTVRELGRKGLTVQRYKGLGEMNPEQLFETTMDPAKRKLLKIVLDDTTRADEIFTTLMGDEVEPRRLFIEENALNVKNLDI